VFALKNPSTVQPFPSLPAHRRQRARSLPQAPRTVSAEAQKRWRELVREYDIRDAAGLQILATAMEAFDRMRGAQADITRDGPTYLDRFGQRKAHPLLSVERDARAAMLAAMKALNLDLEPLRDRPGRPCGGR
jgi:P27 family predicted phage terminase small subunit